MRRFRALVAFSAAVSFGFGSIALLACAPQPPALEDAWLLACTPFPPGDEIADCARRGDDGRITIRPEVAAELTAEGMTPAAVLLGGEPYYVAPSGATAQTLWFDNGPDAFSEGLARTIRDGKIGFVDENLVEIIASTWDFAFPFEEGFSQVCTGCVIESDGEHGLVTGGAWGYIDLRGEVVVPVVHDRENLPLPSPPSLPGEPG